MKFACISGLKEYKKSLDTISKVCQNFGFERT